MSSSGLFSPFPYSAPEVASGLLNAVAVNPDRRSGSSGAISRGGGSRSAGEQNLPLDVDEALETPLRNDAAGMAWVNLENGWRAWIGNEALGSIGEVSQVLGEHQAFHELGVKVGGFLG